MSELLLALWKTGQELDLLCKHACDCLADSMQDKHYIE